MFRNVKNNDNELNNDDNDEFSDSFLMPQSFPLSNNVLGDNDDNESQLSNDDGGPSTSSAPHTHTQPQVNTRSTAVSKMI